MKTIVSLFDWTGVWPRPYADAGYRIVTLDIKPVLDNLMYPNREHIATDLHNDFLDWRFGTLGDVQGVLIAMPCTDFSCAGARHFKAKDADGRTAASIALCRRALELKDKMRPEWWALENPRSRIHKLVPELGDPVFKFHPCDFGGYLDPPGDTYRKETWLWGNFTPPVPLRVEPPPRTRKGFDPWYNKVGGKSEATKAYRSTTPLGFARAFFRSNP